MKKLFILLLTSVLNVYVYSQTSNELYQNGVLAYEQGNYERAYNYFIKISDEIADAQFYLGSMHLNGDGVIKDVVEAKKWFLKAADLGFAEAQFNLGCMHLNGVGVTKDVVEARKWFLKAADQGLAEAQFNLGCITKDIVEAKKWFLKAADQGFAEAQCRLGKYYIDEGNPVEAKKWFEKGASQNHAMSLNNLGVIFEQMKEYPKFRSTLI